ncbi:putative metal-dependent hydrolase [Kaistella sp. DKR-2]|uniref:YfiT family bacillithiol transferase n=1 Tax=Kaistella soli TaxID=2849654 RepID=UPI001C27C79F|nr:putative metal-dependent hydrolase [Kaistella soli]MBU8881995.1 putative metal-dependent hydrolase [Kaistella soli]
MDNLEYKKYPIGKFQYPEKISDVELDGHIEVVKDFPGKLKCLVEKWSDDMLDTQYREGGWTVRQLINHLSDSHMQSVGRFKMALTEDNPTIKPYDETKWAELQDSRSEPIKAALLILEGLHCRWIHLLKTMTNKEFDRTYFHPDYNKKINLRENLAFYAWHCDHHYAHIENLKKEKGW